jgi:hypothetical protein
VGLPLWAPPHNLLGFVDLETRLLQVLHHLLGELLARVVGDVLPQEPAQEIAAAADGEADRERKLVAEGAVIHQSMFLICSHQRSPVGECVVKGCRKPMGARCS